MITLPDGKVLITAEDVQNACRKIADEIKNDYGMEDIVFDHIVMINRGGIVPGGYLSYYLNNRNTELLDITLYEDNEEPREVDTKTLIKIADQLKKFNGKTILLVDDLTDTGETIEAILEANHRYTDVTIYTAVMYRGKNKKDLVDFYAEKKPKGWLVFPWDV